MITIEHLAPYLSYGLKIHDPNRALIGLDPLEMNCTGGTGYFSMDDVIKHDELKPIMRLFADLTDINWIDIFKTGLSKAWPGLPISFIDQQLSIEYHDGFMIEAVNEFGNSFSFEILSNSFTSNGVRFNQLAGFNELYKLHCDFNDLITRGLAIYTNISLLKP